MNSKELLYSALLGKDCDRVPVVTHSWGLYKFQIAGLANGYEDDEACWNVSPQEFADVEGNYYEKFKPDWFHLGCNYHKLRTPKRKEAVMALRKELRKLESKAIIDEYLEVAYYSGSELRASDAYDHVPIVVKNYGDTVFIAMNEANPVCEILDPGGDMDFEEGLIALMEKPDMMEYLLFRAYEKMLDRIQILSDLGCHGYIGSETYCTPDIISPTTFRDVIFPAQKYFYEKAAQTKLLLIPYFLGDVLPLLQDINQLKIHGLMVEESKKSFNIDVVKIRKLLSKDITLFGNLDTVHTLYAGTVNDVVNETLAQLEATAYGSFVVAHGAPIAFDTPAENIHAMIKTAKEYAVQR